MILARRSQRLPDNERDAILCFVSTPAEIESAIERLPTGQVLEVAAWLDDYRAS
jgi:hypothetical protein